MQDTLRARLNDELDALREKNLYRKLRVVEGHADRFILESKDINRVGRQAIPST